MIVNLMMIPFGFMLGSIFLFFSALIFSRVISVRVDLIIWKSILVNNILTFLTFFGVLLYWIISNG